MNQVGSKSGLRAVLRRQRNALSQARQERAAVDLAERLKNLSAFRRSKSIALYLANDGEIDPARALAWSLAHGKRCYAPVVVDHRTDHHTDNPIDQPKISRKNSLRFAEITTHTRFQNNRFGIAEPTAPAEQWIDARALDLVLLPLVGFDRRGNRIGMGGGFYDTTFAFKKTDPHSLPQLVGLAHEIQRVEQIDAENWDIPIAAVVTDRQIYRCAPGDARAVTR